MSHIHVPDGMLPAAWLLLGYGVSAALLAASLLAIRRGGRRQVPRLGGVAALMMLAMSVPLGVIPTHVNLTTFAAIALGPWAGVTAVFAVNLFLALLGHGGLTVLGLNSAVMSAELGAGWLLFRWVRRGAPPGTAAALAAAGAVAVSFALMLVVLGVSFALPGAPPVEQAALHAEPRGLWDAAVSSPLGGVPGFSAGRFGLAAAPVAALGIVLEAMVVGGLVSFVVRVRPDMLEGESLGRRPGG